MPIGPECRADYVIDSLDSFDFYRSSSYAMILADDSGKGTGHLVRAEIPEAIVIETPEQMGKGAGLYITLSLAFRYALANFEFEAVLRMDTDALVIGHNPEWAALELFANDPSVGIAGQYPLDYNGNPWDISYPKQQLDYYTSTRHLRHKTIPRAWLWLIYKAALRHGYRTGESVFGGAYFITRRCLLALRRRGWLPLYPLKQIELEEDHLFSLLARAAGFTLGDLSSGSRPMGCEWKGLPASPEELYTIGKKIIHSTRYWQEMTEEEIRDFFVARRMYESI